MNTHSEIKALLGAYAIDAIEPDERSLVEDHISRCDMCAEEVARHRLVASMIADSSKSPPDSIWDDSSESPPESLWGRVESAISEEIPDVPDNVVPFRRRALPALLSIAAAVLVAVVGLQASQINSLRSDVGDSQQALASLQMQIASGDFGQVMVLAAAQPDSQTLTLEGAMGSARVVILADGTGYLETGDMQPTDSEHVFQLWAVQAGKVISAGLMDADGPVTPFHIDPSILEGLVLTVEEAGGVAVSTQSPAAAWLPEA